jgi:hypothetical protein
MPPSAQFDGNGEFVRATVLCSSRYQVHQMALTDWERGGERGVVVCVHGLTRQGRGFDALARELAHAGIPGDLSRFGRARSQRPAV